tara:strand:- start:17949 stop:18524 length:576 start_codon:yes stop_codon:yes gene_type:complete
MSNYKEFTSWVDVDKWNIICSEIYNAKVLNESSNRMTKEKWILAALKLSNHKGNIDWVDCYDYDVVFEEWNLGKVEIKTGNNPMFSKTMCKQKDVVKLKLKNIYESSYDRETLDKDFDHLMVVNLSPVFCVAFCDYATANKHLVQLKDGFLTKIPKDELTIVYKEPNKFTQSKINFDPKSVIIGQLQEAGY